MIVRQQIKATVRVLVHCDVPLCATPPLRVLAPASDPAAMLLPRVHAVALSFGWLLATPGQHRCRTCQGSRAGIAMGVRINGVWLGPAGAEGEDS